MTDPLAAIDTDIIESVSETRTISHEHLTGILSRHQELMQDRPGVEDLIYEWRKRYPWKVVVERRDTAYYVVVDSGVWGQYASALDYTSEELSAVRAVHSQQVERASGFSDKHWATIAVTRPSQT